MESRQRRGSDLTGVIANTWNRFWFRPVDARRLAMVWILAGSLALLLAWSYAADLETWFGSGGIVNAEVLAAWRTATAVSIFDPLASGAAVWGMFLAGIVVLVMLLAGVATAVTAVTAALFWASLLNRGPMLAGAADDVMAVILWCLVVGRSGDCLSVGRLLADRVGRPTAAPSWRNRTALGLLRVHASAIAAAAVISQLKGDSWWNGTAAWWLAARDSARIDISGVLAGSEYLTNLITHAITLFEIGFAVLVWNGGTRRLAAWGGIIGWPLVGLLAGEPLWGMAMAILAVACLPEAGDE